METQEFTIKLAESSALGKAGQRVTLALAPSDVHDPTELPTYLAGYKPFGYRADEASPPVLGDNDEDKFRNFSSDDAFRRVDVKGSGMGAIPEVDPKSSLATYKVIDKYVGSFIPTQTESQSGNNYQPRMAAARRCKRALELDREIDVFGALGLLSTVANWNATVVTAVAGGDEWNVAAATSDPIRDVEIAIEKSAQPVNAIWFNQKLAHAFLRHEKVRSHMRQMLGDQAPSAMVTQVAKAGETNVDFVIPGLPPFRVVASKVKAEVAPFGIDYILDKSIAILVTRPPGVPTDGEEIATSYTFRRRGPSGTGFESREFFVPGRGPLGGTMVVVSQADVPKMTGSNCGGIITNAHS
jgi:hypothetical protein